MDIVQQQLHADWLQKIRQDNQKDQIAVEKCVNKLSMVDGKEVKCGECSTRCRTHLKLLGFIVSDAVNANRTYLVKKDQKST